jgi:hypothetical protein
MRKDGGRLVNYHSDHSETLSTAIFNYNNYAKEFHLLMHDLEKWNPYNRATDSLTYFLPFEVFLGF